MIRTDPQPPRHQAHRRPPSSARRCRAPLRQAVIPLQVRPVALPQCSGGLAVPVAPVYDFVGAGGPVRLGAHSPSRGLDAVSSSHSAPNPRFPLVDVSLDSALGLLLGCDSATVARFSTSFESVDLAEKAKLDSPPGYLEAVNDGSGDFHDVTSGALDAVGSLPTIRIDGPFGAPTQDVFRHEGEPRLPPSLPEHRVDTVVQLLSSSAPVSASPPSPRFSRRSGALRPLHCLW